MTLKNIMLKRTFDIFLSVLLLTLLTPVLIFISFLIFMKLGHPVFFTQVRPGRNAKPFRMIKFRTMLEVYDESGNILPDNKRLTRFGKFLRATSIDELPELWNVLKGEMSLVGPRPLLMEYLSLYNEEQSRRHDVRPGITGWAQVNGRNAISWEEKFKLDVWYVDNQSVWLDIKILFLTLKKVLVKEGITEKGQATATKFNGTKNHD